MSFVVIAILVVLLVIATLMPLSRHTVWWVRDFDFPRLQIAALALAILAAEVFLLDLGERESPFLMIVTAACLLIRPGGYSRTRDHFRTRSSWRRGRPPATASAS